VEGNHFISCPSLALQQPTMLFRQLFDKESSTYTYLIADSQGAAILVDPVLEQVDRDLQVVQELGLTLKYCLETHIHADHITGTDGLRLLTGCSAILPENAATCADLYIGDGKTLQLGSVNIQAIATPGHTDSHMAYLVNGTHLLTGDALFIRGCGRTDFQSGNAGALYDAVTQKLFTLPEETLVYPAHDYQGQTVSTIGEEKRWNPRFAGRSRSQFIELMNNLDLPKPKKMLEAVPANQQCGRV
jgi:glyoxylase-like metal-dependent hydrolase (beta-lactamase superfamily II)